MNTVVTTLLKILAILFIATTSITTVIFTLGTLIAAHNRRALNELWTNTLRCDTAPSGEGPRGTCPGNVTDLPVPLIQEDNTFDPNVALYCADLVYRVTKNVSTPLQPPKHLTLVAKLRNLPNDPVFGMLWTYKHQKTGDTVAFVIMRGTMNLREWAQDFTYDQEVFQKTKPIQQAKLAFLRDVRIPPNVHSGFLDVYGNFRMTLVQQLLKIKPKQVLVAGHSLGAGVATICALDLKLLGYNALAYTVASPRVGDNAFCDIVKSSKLPLFRIVNTADMVPTLPPPVAPRFNEPDSPYIFTHCGELISFTDNWESYFNNHLMPVYLTFLRLKSTEKN
jgi:hypothetical protein